jgi:hypothetical protein
MFRATENPILTKTFEIQKQDSFERKPTNFKKLQAKAKYELNFFSPEIFELR